ncbi:hypothetical protein [Spongiibacter tropicus]|uniref:hypothetical protein n=1 Tax=Spongiibacter tropicus TaxID=454602 RepID=UPI003A9A1DAC
MAPDTRSVIQKVKDVTTEWLREIVLAFIPAVADKFYDLNKISKEAYLLVRMSANTGAALAASLAQATPEWGKSEAQ